MLLNIDVQSESPIYTQLIHQIIEGIARKELKPGEPLPSVRSLASDLGINLHTVNKAYHYLKQEGYVQIHRQKGATIHPDPVPLADESYTSKLYDELRPLIADAICRKLTEEEFNAHCSTIFQQIKHHE